MPLSNSILTRLQFQHETVSELIAGITEQRLKQRLNPEKWSAFENIAHLAAYQPVFYLRLERIASENDPGFERYTADQDPSFTAYLEKTLSGLTGAIVQDRLAITAKLGEMSETVLQRTGIHPKFGRLTMSQWTEFFLLHEAHHLFTLFRLVQDLRMVGTGADGK
jgi:DinB superfamily